MSFIPNSKTWMFALLTGSTLSIGAGTYELESMSDELKQTEMIQKSQAIEFAQQHHIPVRKRLPNGGNMEIQKIENGIPFYYITHNADAAVTTRTNHLWSTPYSTTGSGYSKLGEWDGGAVRASHQELTGRITQMDSPSGISDHSTHVAGTLIASGVEVQAKGMAYQASLKTYDWNSDSSEMANAASNSMEVSNHSYGYITGWEYDGTDWHWYGDTTVNQNEAYGFGFYGSTAQAWDTIAYNAPHYLIVKSAGNDRNDDAPPPGTPHTHNGSGSYTDTHYDDGYDNGGFDTIAWHGVAKNILTVGAVNDIASYSGTTDVDMSSFSGWGPADDGRIKPDIVGNGVGLYSSIGSNDAAYASYSGTSMASPNVAGTLALLQQYYQSTHTSSSMHSATLKALVLHTADEAGSDTGPDYKFGWGLLNAQEAADKIQEDVNRDVIDERSLSNGGSYTKDIVLTQTGTEPLKVTIVWTDPAGTPPPPSLDPSTKMLVNDLDLKIVKDGTTTYYPWKLDKNNPDNAATNDSENNIDNVEQVYIESPTAGTYQIIVDHDGNLTDGTSAASQDFSIILSGLPNQLPTADAGPDKTTQVNQSVTVTGSGTDTDGTIVSYEWKEGATVLSSSASFSYTPTTTGDHTLTLTVTDNDGATDSDTMIVTATSASGGGGGCTYNPDSKNFDLMFLVMLMMSIFYPLRRRYIQ